MRKMKDSGIEWIGYIPEDWKLIAFRHILKERNEKNEPVTTKEGLSLSIDKDVTKELMSELDGSLDKIFND